MNSSVSLNIDPADVTAIAESVLDELRANTHKAETQRRLPPENIALLADKGLLQILQPVSCGGHELTMRAHLDAVSTVSRGCHATGWVLGVSHAHSWLMGHINPQAQADVYGTDSAQLIAAVIGPLGHAVKQADGSFVLSGFWPFASGNAHANWMLLGARIFDESGRQLDEGDLLLPMEDIEQLDDWRVAGLQGTGSSSVKCTNVSVPAHRFLSFPGMMENETEQYTGSQGTALFKSQAAPVLNLCIASSCTGVARSALDEFIKTMPGKPVMYTDHVSHEWIPMQQAVGEAASNIHAAELILYRVADDIDDYAGRGEKMPLELRARIRMDLAHAPRLCKEAVQKLFTIGGAAGLSLKSPIQLAARNLQAVTMHGALLADACAEIYGRVLLGGEPGTPVI